MKRFRLCLLIALAACIAAAPAAWAQTGQKVGQNVTGAVLNLTTGKPLANTAVTLVQLQGNMNTVATTTTDGGGHYRFSENTPGPFMVQAVFQGVSYFAKVAKGQSETNLSVYNVSADAKLLRVDAEIVVLQPAQGQLDVINEYRVENGLQPMRTLSSKSGLFRFRVPAGAPVDMVRVMGPGEMPLARKALPTAEHDVYSVNAPLRPGETRIQVAYRIPYAGLKAALSETPVVVPAHYEVYVPSAMSFTGPAFTQVGTQQGYNVYGIASGLVTPPLQFQVSGDAPMPPAPTTDAGAETSAAPPAGGSASAGPEASAPLPAGTGPVPTPTFLERNKWTVFMLLALAAAAGFGILLSRPEPAAAASPGLGRGEAPCVAGPGEAGLLAGATQPALPPTAPQLALPADDLTRLKDDLFLLEVRRHTGNIDEAEYARTHAALLARMDHLARR